MLHRSFKPAKCKTSLKLSTSRIKLMKNKKEVQLKQLKKEVAQLLESGQDRTARIRVEHVVREEKTMAAYELLEIYCELIVARLNIIESQKNCPIDLKEAIASVIFAAPRCADIPELLDVSKHFTAKYGKEFKSAAVELRPNCGVSRMVIEKLSATAPDGQTKMRILSAIAEEHNIEWDGKSVGEGESKPLDDLLNGPNSFEMAGKMHAEPPFVQAPKVQAPPSPDQKQDSYVSSLEQKSKSSETSQNFASADLGDTRTTSTTSLPEVGPSGIGAERMEARNRNDFPLGHQNWNMGFKDATSAAQAAAEAAERASMAARAAAELASHGKISRQYSPDSQNLNVHGMNDKGPGNYDGLKLPAEHLAKNTENNSFYDRNPEIHDEHRYGNEHDYVVRNSEGFYKDGHDGTKRPSESASSRSRRTSIDDDMLNSVEKVDRYYQKDSSDDEAVKANEQVIKRTMKKQESEVESVSGPQDGLKFENLFGEETTTKHSSNISSHSNSSTLGGAYDGTQSHHQKFENDSFLPFLAVDEGNITRDSRQTSSYDNAALFFDESGSDDYGYKFDTGPNYDEQESKLFASPPTADSWSFKESISGSSEKSKEWHPSPMFSESVTESAEPSKSNLSPLTFDESDHENSENEDELDKSRHSETMNSSTSPQKQNVHYSYDEPTPSASHRVTGSSSLKEGNSRSDRKPRLDSSYDDTDSLEVLPKNNQDTALNANFQRESSSTGLPVNQQSDRLGKSKVESSGDEFLNQSSPESGTELNFGTLTGGLRNKGYRLPPYRKDPSIDALASSKNVAEDRSSTIEHSSGSSPVKSSISSGVSKEKSNKSSSRAPIKSYNSDSDYSNDESLQQTPSSKRESYHQKEVNTGPSLRASGTYFDSDSETEVELPKQTTPPSRGHSGGGFSRRTKTTPPSSATGSRSKVRFGTEASADSDYGAERKPSLNIYGTGTQPRHDGGFEQSTSVDVPTSKPMPESKSEESSKSSKAEQPSSNLRKPKKTFTSSEETADGESPVKRENHVHPKLPNYDQLAARLQNLRSNQQ